MTKDGVPNAEEHPPFSPFKGGKSVAKRDVIPSKGEFAGLTAQAIESRILRGERLYQSFFNRFDDGFRFGVYCQFVIDAVNM